MKNHSARALFRVVTALLAACASSSAASKPQLTSSCPADEDLANLIADSNLVIAGRMDVPQQKLDEARLQDAPDYVSIRVAIDGELKGDAQGDIVVRFYPKDAPYKPSNALVADLSGMPAVLFLTSVEQDPEGFYFAGYTSEALRPATPDFEAEVRAEIERQSEIARTWRQNFSLPHYREVEELIAQLGEVSGGKQQWVFDQLEALGADAVPAIIAQMDVRRPLKTQAISLVNRSPEAFEGLRHYGPRLVVDGLAAILNQITGVSFGSIENGGSDRQRDKVVAGWRVFGADLPCRAAERAVESRQELPRPHAPL